MKQFIGSAGAGAICWTIADEAPEAARVLRRTLYRPGSIRHFLSVGACFGLDRAPNPADCVLSQCAFGEGSIRTEFDRRIQMAFFRPMAGKSIANLACNASADHRGGGGER